MLGDVSWKDLEEFRALIDLLFFDACELGTTPGYVYRPISA